MFPLYNHSIPKDGFTGHGTEKGYQDKALDTSHDVASTSDYAQYRLGTVIPYYNETVGGYGACMYVSYRISGSESDALAAGSVCGRYTSSTSFYVVTSDQSEANLAGGFGIALSGITTTLNYGWMWVWGVCPDFYCDSTTLFSAKTLVTDGNLDAGESFTMEFSTTDRKVLPYTAAQTDTGTTSLSPIGYTITADGSGTTIPMSGIYLNFTW